MADQSEIGGGPTCFVIGPIGSRYAPIGTPERTTYERSAQLWEDLFEPACERFGLRAVRADKLAESGEIPEQIFLYLRDAELVIADLSGGNPNVMYELGLRHTQPKATIQVGEYERLPFDVNTIRTIQFKRTEAGLADARERLAEAIEAALAGKGSPVTATRLWQEAAPASAQAVAEAVAKSAISDDEDSDDGPGFIDVLADGELAMERVSTVLEAATVAIEEIGGLLEGAGERIAESDSHQGGFGGRLRVAQQLALDLADPVNSLATQTATFLALSETTDAAVSYVLEALESTPSLLAESHDFLESIVGMGNAAEQSTEGIGGMMEGAQGMRRLAKSLAAPARVIQQAMGQYLQGVAIIVAWRDRAQALLLTAA